MPTDTTTKPHRTTRKSAPLPHMAAIRVFLDQTREAFKMTLQQLADNGVTIRSYTELYDHVVDVENRLPVTQQLIIHAYRQAMLVSTVEALWKQTDSATSSPSDDESTRPGRDKGQE